MPPTEQQSELRGVLHALLQRRPGERLIAILDSFCVYKDIVEWSLKGLRHQWRTESGEVGHRHLWEQTPWERERAGTVCSFAGSLPIWGWMATWKRIIWRSWGGSHTPTIDSRCQSGLARSRNGRCWDWSR